MNAHLQVVRMDMSIGSAKELMHVKQIFFIKQGDYA